MICRLSLSLLGLVICINIANAQLEDVTLSRDDLSGPVRQVKTLSYDVSESETGIKIVAVSKRRNSAFNEKVTYNPKGKRLSTTHYRQDGRIIQTTRYHYNTDGYLFKKTKSNPDSTSHAEIIYSIDSIGNILHAKPGKLKQAIVNERKYSYDKQGNLIEYIRYTRTNSDGLKTHYLLNDDQQISEIHYYDRDGVLTNKNIFKYDDRGNQIEKNRFNIKRNAGSKIEYFYDDDGYKIESRHYSYAGNMIYRLIFTNDPHGNITTKTQVKPDGTVMRSESQEYVYDEYGNWIKKNEYIMGKAKYVVERNIDYY